MKLERSDPPGDLEARANVFISYSRRDLEAAEKLIADGLSPEMPVAVIENATRTNMRVLRAPLAGLADLVTREKVKSPAVIVIGEVTAEPDLTHLRALALEAVK